MVVGKRRKAPPNQIEVANRKSDADFIADHLQPSPDWTHWTHPRTKAKYTVQLRRATDLTAAELQACFDLIEQTSGEDYRTSSMGWHPSRKMKEMKSPDLRYILVQDENRGIRGFTSLMPTFEEGQPVVYCYEIHLETSLQGTGLGKLLMGFLSRVAEHTPPIEKVMLTCFLSNSGALKFYEKLGFEKDDISPDERQLRFGKVFVPDYVIMSRRIQSVTDGGDAGHGAIAGSSVVSGN